MSLIQCIILGIIAGCTGVLGAWGTSVANYTFSRPLVGALLVGIVLGDIQGAILIAIPMQIIYIALVTPGGTVAADLRAVTYIGIPLAYVAAKSQGLDFSGAEAYGLAGAFGALVGTVGTVMFYGTAMMNLLWQHYGWAQLDKGNYKIVGKVDALFPLISQIVINVIPTILILNVGSNAIASFKEALPMGSWYMKTLFTIGSLLPAVGIAILLKSVVTKTSDLLFFVFGFALAAAMGVSLLAATAIGGVFAYLNYRLATIHSAGPVISDEEDI
ncbi:MAG: PTS sugar transporter subunit IIC [Erysipelotrichaceae bacterium]|jgi:PTS system mannose-specific IIC component|nr:PTS sugar transporter subunit IIC [Erysipelotrichaceae bacterium]